jgi:hypothetical protein
MRAHHLGLAAGLRRARRSGRGALLRDSTGTTVGRSLQDVLMGKALFLVRWTLRASEIVKLPPCPEYGGPDPDVGCLLFEHHPGRCTFERED